MNTMFEDADGFERRAKDACEAGINETSPGSFSLYCEAIKYLKRRKSPIDLREYYHLSPETECMNGSGCVLEMLRLLGCFHIFSNTAAFTASRGQDIKVKAFPITSSQEGEPETMLVVADNQVIIDAVMFPKTWEG